MTKPSGFSMNVRVVAGGGEMSGQGSLQNRVVGTPILGAVSPAYAVKGRVRNMWSELCRDEQGGVKMMKVLDFGMMMSSRKRLMMAPRA